MNRYSIKANTEVFEDNFNDFEENFANNLENYTSEQLIQEIRKRGDLMIVGNWFTKEHIMDLCGANEMEATAFMGDCDPCENDAVLESANIELQALYENWQDEDDQCLSEQKDEYIQVAGELISKKSLIEELEGLGTEEEIDDYIKNACLNDFYGDETYCRHFSRWLEINND